MVFDLNKLNTTVTQTYITDPKDLYFSADHNNIPNYSTYCGVGKGERGGHDPDPQFLKFTGKTIQTDKILKVSKSTSWLHIVMSQS